MITLCPSLVHHGASLLLLTVPYCCPWWPSPGLHGAPPRAGPREGDERSLRGPDTRLAEPRACGSRSGASSGLHPGLFRAGPWVWGTRPRCGVRLGCAVRPGPGAVVLQLGGRGRSHRNTHENQSKIQTAVSGAWEALSVDRDTCPRAPTPAGQALARGPQWRPRGKHSVEKQNVPDTSFFLFADRVPT